MKIDFIFVLLGLLRKNGGEKMPYSLRNAVKKSLPPVKELELHIQETGALPKHKIIHENKGENLWDALCVTEEQYRADVEFLRNNSCDGEVLSEDVDR